MKTSTRLALWGFIVLTTGNTYAQTPYPDLMRFDTAPANVQEYIVYSITGCVRSASIVLMRFGGLLWDMGVSASCSRERQMDMLGMEFQQLLPVIALGLEYRPCVEVLKGDPSVGGGRLCYLYRTPRLYRDPVTWPRIWPEKFYEPQDLKPDEFMFLDGTLKRGRGKYERWRIEPPYDPYHGWFLDSDTAQLAILTPERQPLMDRVGRGSTPHVYYKNLDTMEGGTIKAEDAKRMKPDELVVRLSLDSVFSNRVFRLNEGCAFHVDYELPKVKRRPGVPAPVDVPPTMMRLSPEEVSEVVRLAYAVDGDATGYDAACARCPQLLWPVTEFRTGIGRMLREALSAGGMLPNGAPPAAKE